MRRIADALPHTAYTPAGCSVKTLLFTIKAARSRALHSRAKHLCAQILVYFSISLFKLVALSVEGLKLTYRLLLKASPALSVDVLLLKIHGEQAAPV